MLHRAEADEEDDMRGSPVRVTRIVTVAALSVLIVLTAGALLRPGGGGGAAPPDRARPVPVGVAGAGPAQDLTSSIAGLQERLRRAPGDARSWAELGLAYVQQARITADPAYYPKAEGALGRSVAALPEGNLLAQVGLGALAAARHDFAAAERHAREAVRIDGYSAPAHGVLADALIELGRYDQAYDAVQRMADLQPATASYARASYTWELRGDVERARSALELALQAASTAADEGFALYHLGELAFSVGDLGTAAQQYDEGLRRAPDYLPLHAGRARVLAAQGRAAEALTGYRQVVARLPQPAYAAELGDLLAATGDRAAAEEQFALVRTGQQLLADGGMAVDLELALFDADHGRPAQALAAARKVWSQRRSIHAADALAWALHVSGRDAEALPFARSALRLGTRSAELRFHLGTICAALGRTAEARTHLRAALAINPHFSPVHAPAARAALARLGSR